MATGTLDRARLRDPGVRHRAAAQGSLRCDPEAVLRPVQRGRLAHWLLLVAADRVDAYEEHLRSFTTTRPDNPVTETGVRAEFTHHGLASRRGRVDVRHQVLDPVIVAGPWLAAGWAATSGIRKLVRAARR